MTTLGVGGAFLSFSKNVTVSKTIHMALKIRLSRIGAVHKPIYHVVVAEARSRRDGSPVELLGTYTPQSKSQPLILDLARAEYWLSKGAIATDTARGLINKAKKATPAA